MEFPKDVVCIKSMPNPAWDSISRRWVYLVESELIYESKIYKAIDGDKEHYSLEGKNPRTGYTRTIFRDVDEIQITEIIEILKEEPCLI